MLKKPGTLEKLIDTAVPTGVVQLKPVVSIPLIATCNVLLFEEDRSGSARR